MNGIIFCEKSVKFYQSTLGQVSKRELHKFVLIEVRPKLTDMWGKMSRNFVFMWAAPHDGAHFFVHFEVETNCAFHVLENFIVTETSS